MTTREEWDTRSAITSGPGSWPPARCADTRTGIADAQVLIRRRGPAAVVLGRFIAFFRAMMPALAGASHMRYRTFLLFNALGGLAWGVGFTLLGYFAGSAYTRVEHTVGRALALALAAVVIAVLVAWHLRRRRAHREAGDSSRSAAGDRRDPLEARSG
ncbi:DedA family protein [Streptomyces sp. NPDC051104]|uniref:DedA family protein n=1 Tax=Streptomyces sp. NPDC051104 TaxID=3155044 RepID=UPI00342BA33E